MSDVTHNLDYNLVAPLGNGSYAIVYLVQEVKTGKLFALKCLSKMSLTEEQLNVQANEVSVWICVEGDIEALVMVENKCCFFF